MAAPKVDAEYLMEIERARRDLRALMYSEPSTTVMLCLAWHHAGTYNANTKTGGPDGFIKNMEELKRGANAGLAFAINLCEKVKAKHPKLTYADIFQLAGVVAVEAGGGPSIEFVPGRKDSIESPEESRHPEATQGAKYLRDVFYRMGLSDKDIVALSGSKILGKADNERSGFESLRWSREPLKFDNSYFVELMKRDSEGSLTLPTDKALVEDPKFRRYVALYAENEDAFFMDYAESHKKLSELGFTPPPSALHYVESHKKLTELGFTPPPSALDYVESHKKLTELGFTPPPLALGGVDKSSNMLKQSVVCVVVAVVFVIFVYFCGICSQKNQPKKV